jgi:2-polyprenyl-6-hydroxyphenyl methylase/3-demethylubiquinone-9 3-methyltransferase
MNVFEIYKSDWTKFGPFKMLHSINPVRLQYIYGAYSRCAQKELSKARVLDIGCGGGIVSSAIAKKAKEVVGIDAVAPDTILPGFEFENIDIADFETNEKFDLILALEVIEHTDPLMLIKKISSLCEVGGIVIFSTINRTFKALFGAILMAEYVFRLNPIGTHSFKDFVKPDELRLLAELNQLQYQESYGMVPSISQKWKLSNSLGINYFMTFMKTK